MGRLSTLGSGVFSRSIDQDLARAWGWVKDHAGLVIVGLGVLLRLVVYAENHDFCFDEMSLWGNIAGRADPRVLERAFAAINWRRFGFLIAERAIVVLLGRHRSSGG